MYNVQPIKTNLCTKQEYHGRVCEPPLEYDLSSFIRRVCPQRQQMELIALGRVALLLLFLLPVFKELYSRNASFNQLPFLAQHDR